jgi:cardiolipin synthase
VPRLAAATALCLLAAAGCATLPDTDELIARHAGQTARFENARGPLSARQSAAVLAELNRKAGTSAVTSAGTLDIVEKQIALEQAISGSPLIVGNKVALLQDGTAAYAAMLPAIRAARDHINLESYIIEDDETGRTFAEALLERQAAGIQVNVIYDSVGSIKAPKAFFERLRKGGIAVLEFNPVNPLAASRPWLINNRDHRKLLVVDGRTAFLGGINISNVHSSGSAVRLPGQSVVSGVAWRDTHLQVEGPVVAEMQKLFLETWGRQRGPPLAPKDYFPELTAQGSEIVRAIGSTPDDPYSLMYLTLMSAIGNAEREVHLANAYFVPDPQLLKALTDAAARGVDVRLILPSQTDSGLAFHAGRSYYSGLLEGGVRIHERAGVLLHSKTAVIDGVWSSVGSTNLDWRSFLDNDEINAVIIGREFGRRMQLSFNADLEASQAIELEAWRQRPLMFRLKEIMARFWGRLL